MRRFLRCAFLSSGFVLGSFATNGLHAQDELFAKLDANGDGVVTAEEAGEEKKAIFERLVRNADKNGDGKLTKEELIAGLKDTPPQAPQPGGFGDGSGPGAFNLEEMLKRVDKDGDGKVSKEEAPERLRENFARLDANGDGSIDARELQKIAEMMQGNPPRPGSRPEGRPDFPPFARIFDADKNGEISAEEMAAAAEALKKLDTNGDGKLAGAELVSMMGDMPSPTGRPNSPEGIAAAMQRGMLDRMKQADKDGDGKLSKEEAPERLQERFDMFDANKDGFLDQAELQKVMERMREQFGNRPAGDRPAGDRKRPE